MAVVVDKGPMMFTSQARPVLWELTGIDYIQMGLIPTVGEECDDLFTDSDLCSKSLQV